MLMAISLRSPKTGLMQHSDHGSQCDSRVPAVAGATTWYGVLEEP